jgi:hypothetical protein
MLSGEFVASVVSIAFVDNGAWCQSALSLPLSSTS